MSKDPMVKLGQIWRENDPRLKNSRIGKVVLIHREGGKTRVQMEWRGSGRRTWCKIERFNGKSNGYGLVEDI